MPRANIGDRVRVTGIMQNDPAPLDIGDEGIVTYASQEFGQYGVEWESGRSLMLLDGDPFTIVERAPQPAQRHAVIKGRADRLDGIRRYLPANYTADSDGGDVFIHGVDNAGWTLDGYVIPRLASGWYVATEIKEA